MKTFTIEEADKCLPVVEKLVKKAQRLQEKISWLLETNEPIVEVDTDAGFHYFVTETVEVNKEFHKLYYHFYKIVEKLNSLGVIVTDLDSGMIDFPSKFNGSKAFLSWQLGERKISFWRKDAEDFEERQPIFDMDELFEKKDL